MLPQVIAAIAGVAILRAAGSLSSRSLVALGLVMPATLVVGALVLEFSVDHSDDVMLFVLAILVVTPLFASTVAAVLARKLLRVDPLTAWLRAGFGWISGLAVAVALDSIVRPVAPAPFWFYAGALLVPATYAAAGAVSART